MDISSSCVGQRERERVWWVLLYILPLCKDVFNEEEATMARAFRVLMRFLVSQKPGPPGQYAAEVFLYLVPR
jgi:hypothetical protein